MSCNHNRDFSQDLYRTLAYIFSSTTNERIQCVAQPGVKAKVFITVSNSKAGWWVDSLLAYRRTRHFNCSNWENGTHSDSRCWKTFVVFHLIVHSKGNRSSFESHEKGELKSGVQTFSPPQTWPVMCEARKTQRKGYIRTSTMWKALSLNHTDTFTTTVTHLSCIFKCQLCKTLLTLELQSSPLTSDTVCHLHTFTLWFIL